MHYCIITIVNKQCTVHNMEKDPNHIEICTVVCICTWKETTHSKSQSKVAEKKFKIFSLFFNLQLCHI